ncbi:MAG: hypothetical protein AB2693_22205 [Candidatus Thiodiazotropha sp.]
MIQPSLQRYSGRFLDAIELLAVPVGKPGFPVLYSGVCLDGAVLCSHSARQIRGGNRWW